LKKLPKRRVKASEEKKKQDRELQIRAKALLDSGYSIEQIAEVLGMSESTVNNYLDNNGEKE